jgi:hypothetical protein
VPRRSSAPRSTLRPRQLQASVPRRSSAPRSTLRPRQLLASALRARQEQRSLRRPRLLLASALRARQEQRSLRRPRLLLASALRAGRQTRRRRGPDRRRDRIGFRYGDGGHSRDGQRGGRRRFERRWGSRSDCGSRIVGGRRRSQRGGDRDSCGYGGGGRRRRCVSWERSHTDVFRNWHGSRRRRGERSVDIRCTDREIEQGRALPSIPEVVADRSA